jgi:hypothetical protein
VPRLAAPSTAQPPPIASIQFSVAALAGPVTAAKSVERGV